MNYLTIPEGKVKAIHINGTKVWERVHIYGVSWDGSSSSTMTRTNDAVNFSSPEVGKSSPFDSCLPWSRITVEIINSNVLVKIPKFWYKWAKNGASMTLQIADKALPDFYTSPAHADRGDGKGERDYVYLGRYKTNYAYKSESGYAATGSITIGDFRNNIKNLGEGFY